MPGRTIVFFYGFPKAWDEATFRSTICEPLGEVGIARIDFMDGKLMAFVHCVDTSDAQRLIDQWNGQSIDGAKPIQVRFRDSRGAGESRGGRTGPAGGGNRMREDKNSIFMKAADVPFKCYAPKSVENDYHDETGYSRQVIKFSGFDNELSMGDVVNALSTFGPINTFYCSGPGEYMVRFCYDLCNDFVEKHIVEMTNSPLIKSEKIPEGLTVERIDDTEIWI